MVANGITILVADDDPDDQLLIREALEEVEMVNEIQVVEDGQQVLDYLRRQGAFAHLSGDFLPGIIILDLNMPRKDGRETLAEIKGDPSLRRIPVVVLTTSHAQEDVDDSYDLGGNAIIKKPVTFAGLVSVMRAVSAYWLDTVSLPRH